MEKLKVLLLENAPEDAFIVQREVREVATVDVAITGQMFRQMLCEDWDVILIDLNLPDITGVEAIRLVKSQHRDVPVIIVTGSVSPREADVACESGASRFFMKSIDGLPGLSRALVQVHELAKLNEQLIKDNRMEILGHITTEFTHDLNNILHIVVNGPDILRRELAHYRLVRKSDATNPDQLPESIERVLGALEGTGRRGAEMSKQITAFVRGSNGSSLKIVTPEFLLTELGALLHYSFPKDIRLRFDTTHETASIKCDATQIEQLLMNLAVNAKDAMPRGGELDITAQNITLREGTLLGEFVVIRVRDTGTGITDEVLPRIFEPFYTTKDKGKGTGLGLSMAQKIARDHGGDIDVKTGTAGTTFYVYLPQAKQETHAEALKRVEEFNGHDRTVLVVDDEAHMRMFIEMHLKDAKYRALTAASGMEALSFFRSNNNIAALLTDCGMPVMSGEDLAAALRGQSYTLPIIFLTGATDTEEFDPMPDAILRKPFSREVLLGTLKTIFND